MDGTPCKHIFLTILLVILKMTSDCQKQSSRLNTSAVRAIKPAEDVNLALFFVPQMLSSTTTPQPRRDISSSTTNTKVRNLTEAPYPEAATRHAGLVDKSATCNFNVRSALEEPSRHKEERFNKISVNDCFDDNDYDFEYDMLFSVGYLATEYVILHSRSFHSV